MQDRELETLEILEVYFKLSKQVCNPLESQMRHQTLLYAIAEVLLDKLDAYREGLKGPHVTQET